jgi:hypothetical protein
VRDLWRFTPGRRAMARCGLCRPPRPQQPLRNVLRDSTAHLQAFMTPQTPPRSLVPEVVGGFALISPVGKRVDTAGGRAPGTRQARGRGMAAYPARPTMSPSRHPRASRNLELPGNRGPLTLRGVVAIAILIGIAALCALLIANAVSGRAVRRADRPRSPVDVRDTARLPRHATLKTAVWPSALDAFSFTICHRPRDQETPAFAGSALAFLQRNPSDRFVHPHGLPRSDKPSGDYNCEPT